MKGVLSFVWQFLWQTVAMFVGAYLIFLIMSGIIKVAVVMGLPAFFLVAGAVVLWWIVRRVFLYRTDRRRTRKRTARAMA